MNNLTFSGHDTVDLASRYGTPLYVMSEDIVAKRISDLKTAFESTGIQYGINYAGKSFTTMAMCRIVDGLGISLDVVSQGEIMTALMAGFDPKRIYFHGSNKQPGEIRYAIEKGIGHIIIDSDYELDLINRIATEMGQEVRVLFRVSPGIEAHTHELIETGTLDSKFGVPLNQAEDTILKTREMPAIQVDGLHCHIGSQVVDEQPFVLAGDAMLGLYKKLVEAGFHLEELNLGGGFGIPYLQGDESFDVLKYIPKMVAHLKKRFAAEGIAMPRITVEPGRYISAEAGITLYTVGTVKDIPGLRKYVSVDGGMNDNPRPALYGAEYEAFICNGKGDERMEKVTVSGRACENDTLIESVELNAPEAGDILMVTNTGAYNYTMSSNYNRYPRPAVVLLSGDRSGIIVERETNEDVLRYDRIPDWMKG